MSGKFASDFGQVVIFRCKASVKKKKKQGTWQEEREQRKDIIALNGM